MGDLTDQSLLRRVRNRADAESWREFFNLYHPLLMRYARMCGLSHADAEGVAQACMGVLSGHMSRFDYSRSRGKFKSFLRTLANHTISSMFRRRRPRLARSSELAKLAQREKQSREAWNRTWLREHFR